MVHIRRQRCRIETSSKTGELSILTTRTDVKKCNKFSAHCSSLLIRTPIKKLLQKSLNFSHLTMSSLYSGIHYSVSERMGRTSTHAIKQNYLQDNIIFCTKTLKILYNVCSKIISSKPLNF